MAAFQIFISYRRDGSSELAQLLYTRLVNDKYVPFFDVETMRSGKFNVQLYDRIDECSDVLLLLPPKALDPRDTDEDWMRLEIAYALEKGKNIVPVLMRGFEWPSELPDNINDVRYCQGVSADMAHFESVYEKMKSYLDAAPVQEEEPERNIDKQLRHAEMLLKAGYFQEAAKQYDLITASDVECGDAYLGKLMAELEIPDRETFAAYFEKHLLYDHINFKLACEYADESLKAYICSLSWPMCKSHNTEAAFQCMQCGAFICGDCAWEMDKAEEDDDTAPWPYGKILCEDCIRLFHEDSLYMRNCNRIKIFVVLGVIAGILAIGAMVAIKNRLISSFFGVLAVAGMGVSAIISAYRFFTDKSAESFDLLEGVISLAFKCLIGIFLTLPAMIYIATRGIWLLKRMNGFIRADNAAARANDDWQKQYWETYRELVSISRKLKTEIPDRYS